MFTCGRHKGGRAHQRSVIVDLNYLFHRQQVERSRAEAAKSAEARKAHEELAERYEENIEKLTSDEFAFPQRSPD